GFWRGGWCLGPRYLTAMQPFLLPLVAAAFAAWRGRPYLLAGAAGLVIVGTVVYCVSAATFPYWPDLYRNPLYEVTLRLLGDGGADVGGADAAARAARFERLCIAGALEACRSLGVM